MPDPRADVPTVSASQVPTAPTPSPGAARPLRAMLAHLPLGSVISRYRIESVLGEGGMGVVYLARQEKPDRQVALKVVRPGYATERMLRRFEHEAEVLGRLLHPGIAQIYEAGVFHADTHAEDESANHRAQGSPRSGPLPIPFFAMELVKGVPLTRYAEEHKLTTRQRLELVAKVCDAVQHAHQKGVIHRDLKPGNILVTEEGQPKVLDFGVARATDSDIQQTTVQTEVGAIIGTIPYMSPEQVGGDPAELDTRSDVYALGVIAYELLVGRLPYSLERKMIHEAARIIREDEPTRLSSIDRTLRGDVETIVAHALEKDKARRYVAASALAADIRRYLSDEPIAARPASTWYQLTKFSRRNKGLVTGVALAFVFLAAGLAFALVSRSQAVDARDAESNARGAETRERARADERADAAEKAERAEKARGDELRQVSDFQDRMLRQIDTTTAGVDLMKDVRERFAAALETAGVPEAERGAQAGTLDTLLQRVNATDTAAAMVDRTILKPAVKTIDEQFTEQPVVDAQLRQALADLYKSIGLYDSAYPLQKQAMDTRRRVLGEEHPDTLISVGNMSGLLKAQGKHAEAEPYFREVLEKSRRVLGEEHLDTLTSIGNLGSLLEAQGKLAEAEPYYREALEKQRRVRGEEHPDTLTTLNNMAGLLWAQGKQAEAESYLREAVEKFRRVRGEEHPDTLTSINNLGVLLRAQGKLEAAEPYYREALEKKRRVLGEEHPETLTSIANLGLLLQAQGKLTEAEPYHREDLEKCRRVLGADHPDTLTSINSIGFLLQAQGRLAEAESHYQEALERRRRVLGDEHPDTLGSINNMGFLLQAQGRNAEAESYYREAIEKYRRVLGEEHPHTVASTGNMGALLQAQGKHQEAIGLLAPAEPAARRVFTGGNAPRLAGFLVALGRARLGWAAGGGGAEGFTLAEAILLEAHAIFTKAGGEKHKNTRDCAQALADLYTAWDKAQPANGHDAKAVEWKAKLDAIKPPDPAPGVQNEPQTN